MSTEYQPVGNGVADKELRDWRERNYDPERLASIPNALAELTGYVDDILTSSQVGLNYSADAKVAEIQYANSFVVCTAPDFGSVTKTTTLIEAVYRQMKQPQSVREEYHLNLTYYDARGRYLPGTSYIIQRFVGGGTSMAVQRTIDADIAELTGETEYFDQPSDSWQYATGYDAAHLRDELKRIQQLQQNHPHSKGLAL